jgi:hypothetical protein
MLKLRILADIPQTAPGTNEISSAEVIKGEENVRPGTSEPNQQLL